MSGATDLSDCKGNGLEVGDGVVIRARVEGRAGDSTAFVRAVRHDGTEGDLYRVWLAEVERAEVTRDE